MPKNRIFVDPATKISAVLDGNNFENIAIPGFGSGYPMCWQDSANWAAPKIKEQEDKLSPFEKASDFIKGLFQKDSIPQTDGVEDIFGNSIMMAKDNDGDAYLTSMPDLANSPVLAEFQSSPV